jgi:hypothetical protein
MYRIFLSIQLNFHPYIDVFHEITFLRHPNFVFCQSFVFNSLWKFMSFNIIFLLDMQQ